MIRSARRSPPCHCRRLAAWLEGWRRSTYTGAALLASGGTRMQIGVFYFPVDYGIDMAELAPALEERGFGSLFRPHHTHNPVSPRAPFPGGGELPKRYAHTYDPFVPLSFAAAVTKRLMLGT